MNYNLPSADKPRERKDKPNDQINKGLNNFFELAAAGKLTAESLNLQLNGLLTAPEFKPFLPEETINDIRAGLAQCVELKERNAFIKKMKHALKPIFAIQKEQPKIFEDVQARLGMEAGGFIPLNERVSYGVDNDLVHFHLAASYEVKEQVPLLFLDAMQKLTKIVEANPAIKEISGTSWIVATKKYGTMLKDKGFTITEVPPEVKEKYFKDEDRPIARAVISREKFLQTFGNK